MAAERGRGLVAHYQCTACHVIPGAAGAQGSLGPSLEGFALRSYVAGRWPNDAAHVVPWVMDPAASMPGTPMPALGVGAGDARDIAAFLATLKGRP